MKFESKAACDADTSDSLSRLTTGSATAVGWPTSGRCSLAGLTGDDGPAKVALDVLTINMNYSIIVEFELFCKLINEFDELGIYKSFRMYIGRTHRINLL